MRRFISKILVICSICMVSVMGMTGKTRAATQEVTVRPESTKLTNQNVTIEVIGKLNQFTEVKWEYGVKKADYFKKNGQDVLKGANGGYFEAEQNGEYTVYTQDKKGNSSVYTIKVDSIDRKKPSIQYDMNAKDRSKAAITLHMDDENGIRDAVYYYGKLTKADDPKWKNAIDIKGDYFEIYKNGIVSIKVTDVAGNSTIKRIKTQYINRTNQNVTYGMKERIAIVSYYGTINLTINSVEPVKLTDDRSAYLVNYFLRNVKYAGKDTCFSTNKNFKVYGESGKELETGCFDFVSENVFANSLPKQLTSGNDANCSFLVYGDEAPAYVEYYYWNDDVKRTSLQILCTEDFKQEATKQNIPAKTTEVTEVKDYDRGEGKYTGTMVNGKMQGAGTLEYTTKIVYKGEWYEGKKNGYGVMTYANGSTYKGEFVDDERCGFGVYKDSNGNTFTGMWNKTEILVGKFVDNNGIVHWIDKSKMK